MPVYWGNTEWMRSSIKAAAAAVAVAAMLVPSTATATAVGPMSQQGVVTDVRVGSHATFDRFVVEFRKAMPASTVTHKKVLRMDGSGDKVELKGRKNVLVTLEPARAHRTNGSSTIPTGAVLGFPEIREWRVLGDFEGVVTLGIGVRRERAVDVTLLTHPRRLVIDIAH